jgi:hypothetical protein
MPGEHNDMANEQAGAGADASVAGGAAAGADATGGANGTQGGATGALGGADASGNVEHWKTEAKNAFTKRDALANELKAERDRAAALEARVAELAKAGSGAQGGTAGGSNTSASAPTFDPKVVETTAGTAGSAAAKAEMAAFRAEQNRIKLEDTVSIAFKAVGGKYEDLLAPKLEQAIKDGKVAVDAAGRVQGHESFIASLRTTHPILFGDPPPGAIPGGAGSSVAADLRKLNPSGRRGSLSRGPVYTEEQREAAAKASRQK